MNGEGAAQGAASGAATGASVAGPWGAVIGGVAGGVMGAQGGDEAPSTSNASIYSGAVTFAINKAPVFNRNNSTKNVAWFKYAAAGLSISTGLIAGRWLAK